MKKENKSLSEKIELVERKDDVGETEVLLKRYVKEKIQEFLSELTEELCQQPMMDCGSKECGICDNCEKIDKLALEKFGRKLI